jgi:DNA-directed RNA polymerase specialized sigma24 family protein
MYYEEKTVVIVPLEEAITKQCEVPELNTTVKEVLEFIADRNLTDQIYMMCNLLTISGFSQKEIAKHLGVSYQTYRNRLWSVRKDYLKKGTKEL